MLAANQTVHAQYAQKMIQVVAVCFLEEVNNGTAKILLALTSAVIWYKWFQCFQNLLRIDDIYVSTVMSKGKVHMSISIPVYARNYAYVHNEDKVVKDE